ncbi:uncharacterized protein LOC118747626 [Rhagoletis pomonella]|uniref:uncharacterized protein LOC118747626 n=1 Tax=Rhagoletis pomonella TaxID=28610 RepID=UPI00177D374A|nr:uncharacterized protein LOC118747626 [Rhagoletis pomonella]
MRCAQVFLISCLVAAACVFAPTSAKCRTCGLNGIACASENTFHICSHGLADTSQIFTCPEANVCVGDSNAKCVPNAVADCSKQRSRCGVCDGSKLFTCLTSTTFAQCNSTLLLRSISGSCPSGLTCDSSSPEICVVGGAECS